MLLAGWSIPLLAQLEQGALVLISETGEPFRLYLNGEWIAEVPITRAEAHNLPEGPQRAIIYIHPTEGRIVQIRKTLHVEKGMTEFYAIRKRKGAYVIALYNRAPLGEETPEPTPFLPPQTPTNSSLTPQSPTIIFNPTIQVQTGSGTQISGTPQPPVMHPPTPSPGYVGPCNCLHPMSRDAFQQLLQTLRQEPFDQTRLEIAKSIARQNCLLTADVREMIQLLDFEQSRLELAQFAYDYTHDVGNYLIIADAFKFSTTREALSRYIRGRPTRHQCGMGTSVSPLTPSASPTKPCTPCMSPQAFQQALNALHSTGSEYSRLEIAQQIAGTNCPSAQQIRDICRMLSSESSRLEFAKYAYTRTCDPQNYFIVQEALSSALSQQELARYIQSLTGR